MNLQPLVSGAAFIAAGFWRLSTKLIAKTWQMEPLAIERAFEASDPRLSL